jgi:oxygen-independent coproporphyrinogen-3 oxidase
MVGETWDNWRDCIRRTIDLAPDSVTIYQMELPFNTVYSRDILGHQIETPVADWPTKRAWVSYAFDEMGKAGYYVSSAYTLIKDPERCQFVYRDSLWRGADMFGTGVASFGHVNGVHLQNVDEWEQYIELLDAGRLPLGRALRVLPRELLIREMILQLKTGRVDVEYFRRKFGVNVLQEFADAYEDLQAKGFLIVAEREVLVTRDGLLQIDRNLPAFFLPEHRGARYT